MHDAIGTIKLAVDNRDNHRGDKELVNIQEEFKAGVIARCCHQGGKDRSSFAASRYNLRNYKEQRCWIFNS